MMQLRVKKLVVRVQNALDARYALVQPLISPILAAQRSLRSAACPASSFSIRAARLSSCSTVLHLLLKNVKLVSVGLRAP